MIYDWATKRLRDWAKGQKIVHELMTERLSDLAKNPDPVLAELLNRKNIVHEEVCSSVPRPLVQSICHFMLSLPRSHNFSSLRCSVTSSSFLSVVPSLRLFVAMDFLE